MADVKVEVRGNGPLRVIGEIEIVDQSGNNYNHSRGAVGILLPLWAIRQQARSATAPTAIAVLRELAKPAKAAADA